MIYKSFLLSIFLTIFGLQMPQPAFSNTPEAVDNITNYAGHKIEVRQSQYNLYIRRHLQSILKDFFTSLRDQNGPAQEIMAIRPQIDRPAKLLYYLQNICNTESEDETCKDINKEIEVALLEIIREVEGLQRIWPQFNKKASVVVPAQETEGDLFFQVLPQIDQLYFQSLLLERSFKWRTAKSINSIIYAYEKLLINYEMVAFYSLSTNIRTIYWSLWSQALKEIHYKVLLNDNIELMERKLSEWNFALNEFFMKFSKGNLKVPSKMNAQFKVMHTRWNNILKVLMHNS